MKVGNFSVYHQQTLWSSVVPFTKKTEGRTTKPTRSPPSTHCPPHPSCPQPNLSEAFQGSSQLPAHPLCLLSTPRVQTQRDAPPLPGGSSPPEGKLSLLQNNSNPSLCPGRPAPSSPEQPGKGATNGQIRAGEHPSVRSLFTFSHLWLLRCKSPSVPQQPAAGSCCHKSSHYNQGGGRKQTWPQYHSRQPEEKGEYEAGNVPQGRKKI